MRIFNLHSRPAAHFKNKIVIPDGPWAGPGNHEHRPMTVSGRSVFLGSGLAGEARAPE
jgi:hypothetical protein